MRDRAKNFFVLGEQYLIASKSLLEILIKNGNSNCGIGESYEESLNKLNENIVKSDSRLFIPTLFNCYQATELFVKGLLLLKGLEIEEKHVIENMIESVKNSYGEQSEIYKELRKFYKYQVIIIEEFKKYNNISCMKELYESLRYPESQKNNKRYEYIYLKNNGDEGIEQFKKIYEKIDIIYGIVLKEWNSVK